MTTIREHFRRRYRIMIATMVATVVFALIVVRYYSLTAWYLQPRALGFLIPMGFLPLILIYNARVYRCPQCGVPYTKMGEKRPSLERLFEKRLWWDRWDACPKCGIRFDAEIPMSPATPIGS